MLIRHLFLGLVLATTFSACQGKRGPSSGDSMSPSAIREMDTIYFDFDSASISSSQVSSMQKNASVLKKNSWNVNIEGHCDERGTNEYNLALGERRSRATKNYLVNLGVDPSRLNVTSFGEEKPSCYEHDESCWSRSRKAEFTK